MIENIEQILFSQQVRALSSGRVERGLKGQNSSLRQFTTENFLMVVGLQFPVYQRLQRETGENSYMNLQNFG